MNLAEWTQSPTWHAAGWTMLHFLWIGGLLGVAAAAARRVLRRAAPEARYAVALGFLAALTIAPIGLYLVVLQSMSVTSVDPDQELDSAAASRASLSAVRVVVPRQLLAELARAADSSQAAVPAAVAPATPLDSLRAVLSDASARLPWAWLIGTPLALLLVATGLTGAERLRRESRAIEDGPVADAVTRLKEALGVAARTAVGISDRVVGPLVIGVLRPLILLPPAALTHWSADQVEMVLLHELAHVRRRDNLVNVVQRLIESLLFYHPAVWMVSAWVRLEREHCCDAVVLRRTGRPRAYAEALASLAIPELAPRHAVAALANHQLVSRIRHILNVEDRSMRVSQRTLIWCGSVVLFCGAMFAALAAPPDAAAENDAPPAAAVENDTPPAVEHITTKAEPPRAGGKQPKTPAAPAQPLGIVVDYEPNAVTTDVDGDGDMDVLLDTVTGRVVEAGVQSFGDVSAGQVLLSRIDRANRGFAPEQATGAPNTLSAGDQSSAWASATPDGQDEWLELTYAAPVEAVAVLIHETFNPGAVHGIDSYDAARQRVDPWWAGEDPTSASSGRGMSVILVPARTTGRIRIHLRSKSAPGWNEIDAVGLLDTQGQVHWATGVTASSSFADRPDFSQVQVLFAGDVSATDPRDARLDRLEQDLKHLRDSIDELKKAHAPPQSGVPRPLGRSSRAPAATEKSRTATLAEQKSLRYEVELESLRYQSAQAREHARQIEAQLNTLRAAASETAARAAEAEAQWKAAALAAQAAEGAARDEAAAQQKASETSEPPAAAGESPPGGSK